ncbi:hypothetical protein Ae201684P_010058 [Aphanomyces euteiches]|nr:hypothetical protein Ae201684P_010058 [Aphanomyces euteiches]
MHVRVIDSAQPLFDIPPEDRSSDDIYDLEGEPETTLSEHFDVMKNRTRISSIEDQLHQRNIPVEDPSMFEPDLCTLEDWHAEVDAFVKPARDLPKRAIEKEIVSLLTSMDPEDHYMTAATYYMNNPKEWNAFTRDPVVQESCKVLGIRLETVRPRTLESFRHDHAAVVPEMVAAVRFQASQQERQECIALILQSQPLLRSKQFQSEHHITKGKTPTKKQHISPLPRQESPTRLPKKESDRIRLIREAKQLENAERWKETQESIRKAATRRADALQRTELEFKKKQYEAEVKRKSKDAKHEQELRRKVIMAHFKDKKPVELEPQSDQEARLVKEMHKIELNEHMHRATRIKNALEYQKVSCLEKSSCQ